MPQQINLLAPVLRTPRLHFSAASLLKATGLLLVVTIAVGIAMQRNEQRALGEHAQLLDRLNAERQSLITALSTLPAGVDASAVEQQLVAMRQGNAQRQSLLNTLDGSGRDGQRHSDLLALLARSLPPSVWVQDMRWSAGRLELTGGTLDTGVLRSWMTELRRHPMLKDLELQGLRVERLNGRGTDTAAPLLGRAELEGLRGSPVPIWAFQIINAPNPPAGAASAGAVSSAPAVQP